MASETWLTKDRIDLLEQLLLSEEQDHPSRTGLIRIMAEMARAALQPASAWQPIETAPKDGTFVLLYPSRGWVSDVEPYDCEVGYWDSDDNVWRSYGPIAEDYHGPTHWCPLPPAPPAGETR